MNLANLTTLTSDVLKYQKGRNTDTSLEGNKVKFTLANTNSKITPTLKDGNAATQQ